MSAVDYLGFVAVKNQTPVLARANESDRERLKRQHGAGGIIFTNAADMPTLEALLRAHEVGYAFLEAPAPLADSPVVAAPSPNLGWRDDARRRLRSAVDDIGKGDAVFHEDYSFVPALDTDGLDAFLAEAHTFLGREDTTEEGWDELLMSFAGRVAEGDPPVLVILDDRSVDDDDEEEPLPLLGFADLELDLGRGALGGPPPLVQR